MAAPAVACSLAEEGCDELGRLGLAKTHVVLLRRAVRQRLLSGDARIASPCPRLTPRLQAVTHIEKGEVRVGADQITDPAFSVTRNMEDL